jgi:hypothetical protein
MTPLEYLLNGLLIALVVRQMRGRRLSGLALYLPLVIVGCAAVTYLRSFPTIGNDLGLIGSGLAAGLVLGTLCGVFTRVFPGPDGVAIGKATALAAVLWVVGIGARVGFAFYAQHGGGEAIARFSAAHSVSLDAWVTALILMALAEVVSRTLVLVVRSRRIGAAGPAASMPALSAPDLGATSGGSMAIRGR